MTNQEFFKGLRGENAGLAAKLEELRKSLNLEKLYLIYFPELDNEICWGIRPVIEEDRQLNSIRESLMKFMKENSGLEYDADRVGILADPDKEVVYLLGKTIVPYVESHSGRLTVWAVDEKVGQVLIELSGSCSGCASSVVTMKIGVRNILMSSLPWVKKVESVDDPVEPDFGIKDVLSDAKKDEKNGEEKK